ncbi:zinc-dependent alcohol dehydrogenase family protein [Halomonas sp. HP20-15]|uniref:zinc-dependent alcohol dehydrogenase family protein n=1 Tax=Halomonas sp. HP20-15 TaxID=3085901 RepID=UPI002981B3C3|nr:zinc-dependent alcohol dehydrogenase family protein [Halomonas sp. HP20-15]MDW5378407.1 zinc-dependent alcohol dehydrogenase family protein [Halomonas sp. HP20-15]
MTQAIHFHDTGGPEVLRFEEHEPGEPGSQELRVRVEAIGLNRAEAMFRSGNYLEDPQLPAGLGYEGSAVVEAVGDGVSGFAEGDAVSVIPAFSMNRYNLYAERAIVPAHAVAPRPVGLDAVQAAAIWMPFLTAYGALIDIAGLTRGEAVIIPAASSSVGLAAIQIANSVGAVSIAATRTSAKADDLRRAGAAHVIATQQQDIAAEVMRITEDAGARVVFDPVAGPGAQTLVDAMAPYGTYFVYGALSGEPTPFPMIAGMNKALTMRGYTLLEIIAAPERFEAGKRFIYAGIERGDFKPTIARTFGFAEMVEAHRYLESNQQFGKIVVTVP